MAEDEKNYVKGTMGVDGHKKPLVVLWVQLYMAVRL
jgi:hypothetical protein